MQRTTDVVIVGSGVCGALVAARLAARGVRVRILEAGPRSLATDGTCAISSRADQGSRMSVPERPYAPHSTSDKPDIYYLQNGPDKFEATYLRQVGGTTWHWLGTSFRFVPDDFRLRSKFGVGVDWPISYDDLEPWYCEAEQELGVAGDPNAALDAPRSRPYPLPGIPLTYLDQRVAAAVAKLGYSVQPTPQARNSQRYQRSPRLLRQRFVHPYLPGPGKVRRNGTCHAGGAGWCGADRSSDRLSCRGWRRRSRERRPLQTAGRKRSAGRGQGLCHCGAWYRNAKAAAAIAHGRTPGRCRELERSGRSQPDGSSHATELGAGGRDVVAVSRAALDIGH